MSYQDPTYNQNGNGERNQTVTVVNTSSDICVFSMPFFTMSGSSKIDCSEQICDISGVSYTNILTATTECFTTAAMSGDCFNNVAWNTKIYEDNVLVLSNNFYNSSYINDAPTDVEFSGSVVTLFNTLGYNYSFSGTQFSINSDNFTELRIDLNTTLSYIPNCNVTGNTDGDTSCSCPSGTTPTMANDACQGFVYTAATYNGSGSTIVAGSTTSAYGEDGGYFYPDITDITDLPLTRTSNSYFLVTQSGGTVTATNVSNNTFWDSNGLSTQGRLNNVGLSTLTSEWVGFSDCIDITSGDTYYIGIAADNYVRFSIDGTLILSIEPPIAYSSTHKVWHVLPYYLSSGKHIIELEGRNAGGATAFGAEIYKPTDLATLTGATTTGDTGLIFSTADKIGDTFDLGDTIGYSCPSGFAYDSCIGSGTCVQIISNDISCVYTGDCSGSETEIVCDIDFSGLTSGSTNVYPLTGETSINLDFIFTANTSSLSGSTFRYEVYKYNPTFNSFTNPSVYQSSGYTWDSFSATSAFTVSIPVNNLNIDGDYLVKGYYIHDVCTEFASLLGNSYSTASYQTGDEYGLYQSDRDSYFVAFTKADKPLLSIGDTTQYPIGSLVVTSFILDGTETIIPLPTTTVGSDYMLALNGLTLSEGYDYSLSVNGLTAYATLSGGTISGDMFTYVYVGSTSDDTLRSDSIDITSPIVSGTTDNEGTNNPYYNTTHNKYEIYTSMEPTNPNNMVVTLNGVTLANNIDYYQSITNPNRIILEGVLIIGDILSIYYITNVSPQGNVDSTFLNINWTIEHQPQTTNGLFTLELSNSASFTTLNSSTTSVYVVGQVSYVDTLTLSGSVGDTLYYRVKNDKNYTDLCGTDILTTAYSDIIDITIQTNASNSY